MACSACIDSNLGASEPCVPAAGLSLEQIGWGLHDWCRGVENLAAIARARRIDALAINDFLGFLGCGSPRHHLPVPPLRVYSAPRTKIDDRDMAVDMQGQHCLTEEIAYDIVAGEASHRTGVLARHDRRVGAVYWQPSDISGREFGLHAPDLEASIDG